MHPLRLLLHVLPLVLVEFRGILGAGSTAAIVPVAG